MGTANVDLTFTIDFEGKSLSLKRPEFEACEGAFVHWVRQRAFSAGEVHPDPSSRKEIFGAVAGDIASGKYEWEPTEGITNYVAEMFKSNIGRKEWCFLILKQTNPYMGIKQGRDLFERLWKNEDKVLELIEKIKALNLPNLPTPSEDKGPEAEKAAVGSGDTKKSNPS